MCGIVGYISTDDRAHPMAKRHFSDYALMLDTLRGSDSTGIIRVNNEFDVHTAHTTASGRRYVLTEEYDEFMKSFDGWAMIGHNRAATAGSVKLENAHPFTFGDVTMVHNGTLYHQGKTVPFADQKLEVDSMQIARALSKTDPDQKAVVELLEKIDGSFALVWVDRRDQSINMCRNSSRPLHFGFNRDKDIMWFMSDGTHLHAVTASLYKSPSKVESIYSMDKHKLLKFKKGSLVPEVASFRPFVPKTTANQGGSGATKQQVGSALKNAADRWQRQMQGVASKTLESFSNDGTSEGKASVAGKRRSIPANHRSMLTEWYELTPDDLVEFIPEEWIEVDRKQCVVTGKFEHPKWGYQEWPMTLYNVPLVICTAYGDRNWAVKVKGVCSSPVYFRTADVVGLLGELHCYDAKLVMDPRPEPEENSDYGREDEEDLDSGLVVGPEETLIERSKCMELIAQGCIQCGSSVAWEDRAETMLVNEGRDILCSTCSSEWLKEA